MSQNRNEFESHSSAKSEGQPLDDLMLQRWVDNELSNVQIQALLTSAQVHDHWKKIAIAFAENQIWNRSFDALAIESDAAIEMPTDIGKPVVQRQRKQNDNTHRLWSVIMAASLMVLGGAVWQLFSTSPDSEPGISVNPSQSDIAQSNEEVSPDLIGSFDRTTLASYEPDHRLSGSDLDGFDSVNHTGDIPLFDIRRFEGEQIVALQDKSSDRRQAVFSKVLPKGLSVEMRKQMERSGGLVDEHLEFISGRLEDGRTYLIPYRTIRFLPGQ